MTHPSESRARCIASDKRHKGGLHHGLPLAVLPRVLGHDIPVGGERTAAPNTHTHIELHRCITLCRRNYTGKNIPEINQHTHTAPICHQGTPQHTAAHRICHRSNPCQQPAPEYRAGSCKTKGAPAQSVCIRHLPSLHPPTPTPNTPPLRPLPSPRHPPNPNTLTQPMPFLLPAGPPPPVPPALDHAVPLAQDDVGPQGGVGEVAVVIQGEVAAGAVGKHHARGPGVHAEVVRRTLVHLGAMCVRVCVCSVCVKCVCWCSMCVECVCVCGHQRRCLSKWQP